MDSMDVTEPSSDSDTPGFNLAGELARSALSAPPASRSKAVRDLSRSRSSSLSARARMDVGGMLREERSCTKKKQQPRTRSTRHQPQSKFKLQLGLGCDRSSRHAERRSGKQQPHPKRQRASSSAAHKRQPTKKAKATQLKAVDVPECDNRMQFTESPSRAMEESFAWNDKCVSCLRAMMPPPADTQPRRSPPCFTGHYEFAGGGGAEVASRALAASGLDICIVSQADWNRQKKAALCAQDPDCSICRFGDIMGLVVPEKRDSLSVIREEVPLTQYELLGMLGVERCRIPGDDVCSSSSSSSSSIDANCSHPYMGTTCVADTKTKDAMDVQEDDKTDTVDADVSEPLPASPTPADGGSGSDCSISCGGIDNTDEEYVSHPNDDTLLTHDALMERIGKLFSKKGIMQSSWCHGAKLLGPGSHDPCDTCRGRSQDRSDVVGGGGGDSDVRSLLAKIALADHTCVKNIAIERRQGLVCLRAVATAARGSGCCFGHTYSSTVVRAVIMHQSGAHTLHCMRGVHCTIAVSLCAWLVLVRLGTSVRALLQLLCV